MENYLIVGLGNPGEEYQNTRHQIGAMLLDYYVFNKKIEIEINDFKFDKYFNGMITSFIFENKKIFLVKPMTFMNLSGECVLNMCIFFKIPTENILVLQDDISLDIGKYKLKTNSSSGGHNGILNIINKMGTINIKRLKIGILDPNIKNINIKSYVLGKFNENELDMIRKLFPFFKNLIDDFFKIDFLKLLSKYN